MRTRLEHPSPPDAPHRPRRVILGVVAAAVVLAAVVTVALTAGGDKAPSTSTGAPMSPTLATRSIEAGTVVVKIQPMRLDTSGATFKISFDTHSGTLNLDVASQATLFVGATAWPVGSWSGDAPGGHHRQGELSFTPAGAPTGTATLTLNGLSQPVTATWTLGT